MNRTDEKKATDYTYGRYEEIDVLHQCLTNKFHLWVIYKETEEGGVPAEEGGFFAEEGDAEAKRRRDGRRRRLGRRASSWTPSATCRGSGGRFIPPRARFKAYESR